MSARDGLRIAAVSAVCTLLTSVAAVVIGASDGSLALVAFGAVGVFDCGSDCALVAHFHATSHGGDADRFETIALRFITIGLAAVGLVVGAISVQHLVARDAANESTAAIVLAAASLAVFAVLAVGKWRVAAGLASHALRADGHLTAVGAVLAAVTLAGAGASNTFGWWWADPAAALLIAVGALGLSLAIHRQSR